MAVASLPTPCKVQRGTGTVYYWDGVHAMSTLAGGVGTIMNTLAGGTLEVYVLSTGDWDALQSYLQGRDIAVAQQIASYVDCGP